MRVSHGNSLGAYIEIMSLKHILATNNDINAGVAAGDLVSGFSCNQFWKATTTAALGHDGQKGRPAVGGAEVFVPR